MDVAILLISCLVVLMCSFFNLQIATIFIWWINLNIMCVGWRRLSTESAGVGEKRLWLSKQTKNVLIAMLPPFVSVPWIRSSGHATDKGSRDYKHRWNTREWTESAEENAKRQRTFASWEIFCPFVVNIINIMLYNKLNCSDRSKLLGAYCTRRLAVNCGL